MNSAPDSEKVLDIRNLQVSFRSIAGATRAVNGVSLDVRSGEIVGLVGESGCGKTTAGRCLLRLIEPTSGEIRMGEDNLTDLRSEQVAQMRGRMQMVFQDPGGSLTPRMTIGAILREPLDLHTNLNAHEKDQRVRQLLSQVGLQEDHLSRYPHQFSGGQQQRVGVARAIATHPDFIVLDEPTSALDVSVRGQILRLLTQLQEEMGLTYLFISHDLSVIKHTCNQVAVMYLGRIVEIGSTEEIFGSPTHPYTQALLSAVPIPDPTQRGKERLKLPGEVPSPIDLPPGCRLYSRCPYRRDACLEPGPPLLQVGGSHKAACILVDKNIHFGGGNTPAALSRLDQAHDRV
jgi:oligopeptide transport system ATP-binding protein